jgi:hypothetical protein
MEKNKHDGFFHHCWHRWKNRFPTFGFLLLVFGVLWLLSDLNVIKVDVPWWPVLLIVISIGWIINHYCCCSCDE